MDRYWSTQPCIHPIALRYVLLLWALRTPQKFMKVGLALQLSYSETKLIGHHKDHYYNFCLWSRYPQDKSSWRSEWRFSFLFLSYRSSQVHLTGGTRQMARSWHIMDKSHYSRRKRWTTTPCHLPLIRRHPIRINHQGKPAVSYKWTSWVWEITSWSSKLQENCRSFLRNL
jgi:hypothetical protein